MFTCLRCGEEWEVHPCLSVPCPHCYVEIGSPCRRPSEHETFGGEIHLAREQLAVDSGLLAICSASEAEKEKPKEPVIPAGQLLLFE